MAINEIKRGDFIYRDTFFADLGLDKRHTRASIAELRSLLLPKKGQTQPQEPVSHWYEAQLLHYGLPRTKDKNAAKVRLTTAITAGNLIVPAHITQMEADMKKEFMAASRKVKTVAKTENSFEKSTPENKKRKAGASDDAETSASNTRISVTVGDVVVNIDHQQPKTGSSKRQKLTPSPKIARSPANTNGTATKSKTPTPKRFAQLAAVKTPKHSMTNSITPPKSEQRARRTIRVFTPLRSTSNNHLRMHNHRGSDIGDAPPSYESHNFAHPLAVQISGTYDIAIPFDDTYCELTFQKDTQRDQFWAHFIAAGYKGVFIIPDITGVASQQPVEIKWRAQEQDSGQLRFRRDQDGWIMFDGHGGVQGCWHALLHGEDVEFRGVLYDAPNVEVEELLTRWEWFVKSTYGS